MELESSKSLPRERMAWVLAKQRGINTAFVGVLRLDSAQHTSLKNVLQKRRTYIGMSAFPPSPLLKITLWRRHDSEKLDLHQILDANDLKNQHFTSHGCSVGIREEI
jgi:hypothetical protein